MPFLLCGTFCFILHCSLIIVTSTQVLVLRSRGALKAKHLFDPPLYAEKRAMLSHCWFDISGKVGQAEAKFNQPELAVKYIISNIELPD